MKLGRCWEVGALHGHDRVAHDGLLAGFRTYIARFPKDRLTLIVLTNLGNLPDPSTIANGRAGMERMTLINPDRSRSARRP